MVFNDEYVMEALSGSDVRAVVQNIMNVHWSDQNLTIQKAGVRKPS
jgi:hypothetical protein